MNRSRKTLLAAMAVGLAIRLAVMPFLYKEWLDPFVTEHWAFGRVARSLVHGQGFSNAFADTGPTAVLPPVYAGVLAVIFRLFGPNTPASVIAAAVLNSVLSVLTCIPVYLIALRSLGERVAFWAAWSWAIYPYGVYFSADWLWSTCLFALLLTSAFLYSLHLEDTDSHRAWIGFGALTGLATLTEPVALAVAPLWALLSCYRLRTRGRRFAGPGLAAACAFVAVVSPWIVRNYEVFHQFVPVRDGYGLELYLGNSGYSEHWANRAVHPNHNDAELAEYEKTGEIAYMERKRDQALDYIRAHPVWFAWMDARRAVYIWTGFWSFDRKYLEQEPLDPPNVFLSVCLLFLLAFGLRAAFRENLPSALRFGATFVCFPVVYYVSHPEAYYLRPIDPLIAIIATYGLTARERREKAHLDRGRLRIADDPRDCSAGVSSGS